MQEKMNSNLLAHCSRFRMEFFRGWFFSVNGSSVVLSSMFQLLQRQLVVSSKWCVTVDVYCKKTENRYCQLINKILDEKDVLLEAMLFLSRDPIFKKVVKNTRRTRDTSTQNEHKDGLILLLIIVLIKFNSIN